MTNQLQAAKCCRSLMPSDLLESGLSAASTKSTVRGTLVAGNVCNERCFFRDLLATVKRTSADGKLLFPMILSSHFPGMVGDRWSP